MTDPATLSAQMLGHLPKLDKWQDSISALELLIGVIAGIATYFLVTRRAMLREERIERSQAYLQLELASIDIFRYRADKWYAIAWADDGENPKRLPLQQLEEQADQYFYQCLNLFEVSSRFRTAGVIDKQIYGSWVAWFYEAAESPYFRARWSLVYRDNYTVELQRVFDAAVALWRLYPDAPTGPDTQDGAVGGQGSIGRTRREAFYQEVGRILACPIIYFWLDEPVHASGRLQHLWRWWRLPAAERVPGHARVREA